MKVDTTTLTQLIDACFNLSMDGRLDQQQRSDFLAMGKRLRGSLLNLLSATFDEGTPAVLSANAEISRINNGLKAQAERLNQIAQTVKDIGSLVASLDKLIGIAVSFV
jgi:hypothetical protein